MKKLFLTTIFLSIFLTAQSASASSFFTDLDSNADEAEINFLYQKGIIKGYSDNTFRPGNNINRAELSKILVESTGTTPDASRYKNCFSDVREEWFAKYVCYAKEKGWVNGYGNGSFGPANAVNNAEAIKMIVNSQGYPTDNEINFSYFNDVDENSWYSEYVNTAREKAITYRMGGQFAPSRAATRGEIATSIYRAIFINNLEIEEGTYQGKDVYIVEKSPITHYFDQDLFPNDEIRDLLINTSLVLEQSSYEFITTKFDFEPQSEFNYIFMLDEDNPVSYIGGTNWIYDREKPYSYDEISYLQQGFTQYLTYLFFHDNLVVDSWFLSGLGLYMGDWKIEGRPYFTCTNTQWRDGGNRVDYSDFTTDPIQTNEFYDSRNSFAHDRSAECFWTEIKNDYGTDMVGEVVKEWYENRKNDDFYLIRDIVNPTVDDDVSDWVERRYNYIEE